MRSLRLGCALGALAGSLFATAAHAQSTGTVEFEQEIIVTAGSNGAKGVGGVVAPDTSKARTVLNEEIIQRQVPGQSINDVINLVPGVSFQSNDPFGSGGGTLTIRGFDDTRISQTFDGIPLNDTGNYALYSNQQLDPELITQVNVNLGSTDVDSPTAAASGSTVNYRTRNPRDEFGVRLQGSAGDFEFFRVFGVVDTGVFTPWGTKAFIAASSATNNAVWGHRGKIDKQQYNARVYQPIGSNGDFISVAGHYNENRNNFFGSVSLRDDIAVASSGGFPKNRAEREYVTARCLITTGRRGFADTANSCGSTFDERYNPSNTGNVRINSRFTLAENLTLTVDPSYQYTKANGGGTATAREGFGDIDLRSGAANVRNSVGYIGGSPYFGGVDLNGDGDTLDQVRVLAPSQTQTHRYGVISSLRYDINDDHTVRLAYSYDRGRHRQTGEVGLLQQNGEPFDVFPVNNPLVDATGLPLQKRDRKSIALLNQISGEYRGEFLDERLVVNAGVRAPFFKRDLTNYCFTTNANGFVDCFAGNTTAEAAYRQLNPTVQGPQNRVFKYDAILPNAGVVYDFTSQFSAFANYSKGLQVPGTDNLYNAFFFAANTPSARPDPETTNNFDLGVRYRSNKVQAQLTGWYTIYDNRLASSFDPETERNVYRNLGRVDKYGVDGSVSYRPIPELVAYVFGSYLKSEIKDDVQTGVTSAAVPIFARTAGKRESGAPVYTLGSRVQAILGPVEFGAQAKRTGPRYVNDQNLPVTVGGKQVWGAKAPAYTLVDLDARVSLEPLGFNDQTYLQFNVTNVFDKLYVGGFDGNLAADQAPFVQIGSPRTFIATAVIGF